MKRLWLASIAILAFCIQAKAQKYLNIYQDGLIINKILDNKEKAASAVAGEGSVK